MIAESSTSSLHCKHLPFSQMPRKVPEQGSATCSKEYSVITLQSITSDTGASVDQLNAGDFWILRCLGRRTTGRGHSAQW